LRPLELRILRQHEVLKVFKRRLENTVLRSPADALVTEVMARQGNVLTPGDPVMTLVETQPRRVIAYLEEDRGFQATRGCTVRLRPSGQPGAGLSGTVIGVAGSVAEIPPRFWPAPGRARWGRKIFIEAEPGRHLDPGQAFDITFHPTDDDNSQAIAGALR
jgi:hypothetical protein